MRRRDQHRRDHSHRVVADGDAMHTDALGNRSSLVVMLQPFRCYHFPTGLGVTVTKISIEFSPNRRRGVLTLVTQCGEVRLLLSRRLMGDLGHELTEAADDGDERDFTIDEHELIARDANHRRGGDHDYDDDDYYHD